MFHISSQSLIAAGVFAHLLLALAKALVRAPAAQAKLDVIAARTDAILTQVQTVAALLPAPTQEGK